MTQAPWRSLLAHSLHKHRSQPESRYLQLATVGSDRHPANRTVVFRGFLTDTNKLRFVTDIRSQKINQIESNPWAEACWYFPKTREQYRIAGQLILVSGTSIDETMKTARQQMWQELSDAGRSQFDCPPPMQLRSEDSLGYPNFSTSLPDSNSPLSTFCLLLLEPSQVDYLDLRGRPQNRIIYTFKDSQTWSDRLVNC